MGTPAGTRLRRWRRGGGLRTALRFVNWASKFLIVWIGAIQLAPTDALFGGFVQFWHDSAWLWLPGGVMVASISGAIRRHDPVPMDAANAILGEIQDALFGDTGDDDAHHRITLFERVRFQLAVTQDSNGKWRGPWSHWLVPMARSGHGSQITNVRFLCPDDTDNAQGVAGRAWARKEAVGVEDLLTISRSSSEDDLHSYAESTYVSVKWVRKRRPRARSLMGFRVEDKKGEPWGVLVIDSRSPTLDTKVAQQQFNAYAPVLAILVENM